MPLNHKQEIFCQEYMVDGNATQSAIRAGYSKRSAKAIGSALMTNVDIKERVEALKQKRLKQLGATHDRLLQELTAIGYSNLVNFVDDDNKVLSIKSLSKRKTAALSKIKTTVRTTRERDGNGGWIITEDVVTEIGAHNKLNALEMVGRHISFFEADNKQKTPEPSTIVFNAPPVDPPVLPTDSEQEQG